MLNFLIKHFPPLGCYLGELLQALKKSCSWKRVQICVWAVWMLTFMLLWLSWCVFFSLFILVFWGPSRIISNSFFFFFSLMKLRKIDEVRSSIFSRACYFLETKTTAYFIKVAFHLTTYICLTVYLFSYLQQQCIRIGSNEPKKLFLNLENDKLRDFFRNWGVSLFLIFHVYHSD